MIKDSDIEFIKDILYESNSIARFYQENGLEIYCKNDDSPVTKADLEISKYLEKHLGERFTNIETISEEGEKTYPETDLFWLIDPIDGTRSYIKGNKLYTINIGLIDKNKATYGFITLPESDRIYYTKTPNSIQIEEGGEALSQEDMRGEFRGVLSYEASKKAESLDILKRHNISNYRYMPCSAKFCLIASGEADLYPRYGRTMEWDTAAGSALVSASGGRIISIDGDNELLYKKPNLVNKGFLAYSRRLADVHEFC